MNNFTNKISKFLRKSVLLLAYLVGGFNYLGGIIEKKLVRVDNQYKNRVNFAKRLRVCYTRQILMYKI